MSFRFGRSARWVSIVAAASLVGVMLPAPAGAIGNNRVVQRSCGTNYVASATTNLGNGLYRTWAQTQKNSGSCSGTLSANIEFVNGFRGTRVYGTKNNAYKSSDYSSQGRYGLHWGCNNCNVTYS